MIWMKIAMGAWSYLCVGSFITIMFWMMGFYSKGRKPIMMLVDALVWPIPVVLAPLVLIVFFIGETIIQDAEPPELVAGSGILIPKKPRHSVGDDPTSPSERDTL